MPCVGSPAWRPACRSCFLRPTNRRPLCRAPHSVATMNNAPRAGKKRKSGSQELEADRTLYSSFVHAANAVSQLYTAAAQQSKRSEEAGARQSLVSAAGIVAQRPPDRLRGPVLRCLGRWDPLEARVACRGPPRLPSLQLPTRPPFVFAPPASGTGGPVRGQGVWQRPRRADGRADGGAPPGAAGPWRGGRAVVVVLRHCCVAKEAWWQPWLPRLSWNKEMPSYPSCLLIPASSCCPSRRPAGCAGQHRGHPAALPRAAAAARRQRR